MATYKTLIVPMATQNATEANQTPAARATKIDVAIAAFIVANPGATPLDFTVYSRAYESGDETMILFSVP